ncbi:MAG: magnesium-translocating P-type ATPase [Candidatus Kapaibacterium sp.]|jgi:Mg2+-importing ATPase
MWNEREAATNPLYRTIMATIEQKMAGVSVKHREKDEYYLSVSAMRPTDVLVSVESNSHGLSSDDATRRLQQYGRNEISAGESTSWLRRLTSSFLVPFNGVLLLIAAVSTVSDILLVAPESRDMRTLVMILSMIVLSSGIRFIQETRSNKAAASLRAMIHTTCRVMRDNAKLISVPVSCIVPGDIVLLAAGDIIPADARVLESKDLYLSQSLLTGEAMPVEKHAIAVHDAESVTDCENLCFMGTSVSSGTATIVVLRTGAQSLFADIASVLAPTEQETSFDKGIAGVSYVLLRFMAIMVPLVFLINGLTKGTWVEALLFSMSVAVGITPEMLPMIVTTNLARGAMRLMKQKVVVKKLKSVQSLGSMQVLCTDKTGTLTLDSIVLKRHLNVYGDDDDEVLHWAYVNSYFQTGMRNLLDEAILKHDELRQMHGIDERFTKLDEIPFDFERRRMSVIVQEAGNKHYLICKGAVDEMLSVCTAMVDPGPDRRLQLESDSIVPLDDSARERIRALNTQLQEDGMRVLLIAVRELHGHGPVYAHDDEKDLVLVGCIGFLDPAKPTAAESLRQLQQLGVEVKVLTGDSEIVTKKICTDVGIPFTSVMHGRDIDLLSDDDLSEQALRISVFVKLSPLQKRRIVRALQSAHRTVGFLGDGINDAPSLNAADVGISVDTAVNTAKESADMIMMEKDLNVLADGVREGRRTFGNIMKYMKMAASSNFGNVLSMLGAGALLPFLPMLPLHILIQNLLYDISQVSIPWDTMDDEYVQQPRAWSPASVTRFMLWMGPVSSLFDYATFAFLWFVLGASSATEQSLFQSGWFIESMLSQILVIHIIRTTKVPLLQSRASAPVVILGLLVASIALILPFSTLAPTLRLWPVPAEFFPFLLVALILYVSLAQLVKKLYIRRYGDWI